jgi:nucleotide-binding universal stress UspA family protein
MLGGLGLRHLSCGAPSVHPAQVPHTIYRKGEFPMKTIVALVDFSDITSRILDIARTLASAMRSRVVLLHVVPLEPVVATLGAEAPAIPEPPSQETLNADRAKLEKLLDSLTQQGVSTSALQFEGRVVDTVIDETRKLNADLVIMGSHHHSALYNLFIGSVTSDILKKLPFPVLVVPAEVLEKEEEPARRSSLSAGEMRPDPNLVQPVLSA